MDLAELDLLLLVDVPGWAQHDEEGVVIPLDLRPLVRVDRVLDGQRMELELRRERSDLVPFDATTPPGIGRPAGSCTTPFAVTRVPALLLPVQVTR